MIVTSRDVKFARMMGIDLGPVEPVPTVYQRVDRLRRDKEDLRTVNESVLAEIKECDAANVKLQAANSRLVEQRDHYHKERDSAAKWKRISFWTSFGFAFMTFVSGLIAFWRFGQ